MKLYTPLLSLLLAIIANCFTTAKTQVNTYDSLALVDLYNSTDGPHWKEHSNWLTTMPLGTWYGVNVTGKRVTSLFLNSNRLNGTLPPAIGNLTQLTGLYLYENRLSDTIPATIGNLIHLTTLSLSDNRLSGIIPASIGLLIHLQYLDLYSNQLSGAIPIEIGNLTNLIGLYAYNNKLSSEIPAEIGTMAQLKELYLYNNELSGAIPVTIGNLAYLTALELNDNQLSGRIPSAISNLLRIQYLYLNNNQLNGMIPESLGKLKRLIALHLQHNRLSGGIPYSFRKLNHLSNIDLSYNGLSQDENVAFSSPAEFTSGSLSHNRFTFNALEFVAKKYINIIYAPQNTVLPVHQNGGVLSVSAGGTLNNNTYKWFKAGATDSTIIKGDSIFAPAKSGRYYAKVTNAVATQLTLRTDTIDFTTNNLLADSYATAAANQTQRKQGLQVYPNPARNVVYLQTNGTAIITLINSAGKVMLSKSMSNSGEINVSAFANGIYYIKNKITGEVQKVIIIH